jgi:hypothetical protein
VPAWFITTVEFFLGPIIFLVILPVVPTVWIFFIYPLFAYRLNHASIHFSYWARIGMFYGFSAICCAPFLPMIKNTIEHPALLLPLLGSRGFWMLMGYTSIALVFHKQIGRLAQIPLVIFAKKKLIDIGYALFIKLRIAWANGINSKNST